MIIYFVWSLVFLSICALTDIKEKKINVVWCLVNGAAGTIVNLTTGNLGTSDIILGILFGGFLYAVSVISKERLGKGDSLMFLALGCITGGNTSFETAFFSFFACSIFMVTACLLGKIKKQDEFPFAPFILVGNIAVFALKSAAL